MKYSQCCMAELKKEFIVEQFHGCDDDYELKVPAYRCSGCNKLYTFELQGAASGK